MMVQSKKIKMRPYARLLTMLGEQLIKNEQIALIELIKNAYDADSPWVKISFIGFDDSFGYDTESKIIIEDSGCGMTSEIIEDHWLNPATPIKLKRKAKKNTTKSGRIIQGDKGIGRFAILKLGRKIKVYSRADGEELEHVVEYDFSMYDDDFLSQDGEPITLFLDDIEISFETRKPEIVRERPFQLGLRKIKRPAHGTRIVISELKGKWSEEKVRKFYNDVARLESIFSTDPKLMKSFNIQINKDDEHLKYEEEYLDKLRILLEDRPVIFVDQGNYDEKKKQFKFKINGVSKTLSFHDPNITGLKVYRDHFGKRSEILKERNTECGSFIDWGTACNHP